MPRVRRRNAYHLVSYFDRDRTAACRNYGLSNRNVAAHVSRGHMTGFRI